MRATGEGLGRRVIAPIALIAFLAWPGEAAAYIDPGAGSLAWQAVLAIVLGIGVFWRGLRSRIASAFRRRKPPDGSDAPQDGSPPA